MSEIKLPKIDLTESPVSKQTLQSLQEAITNYGAFYVKTNYKDHSRLFESAGRLFKTSDMDKSELTIEPGGFTRGFIKLGGESGSDLMELKEAFSYGATLDGQPRNKLEGDNKWPNTLALQDKETFKDFYKECNRISLEISKLLSVLLTGEETTWTELVEGGFSISLMRIFKYFGCSNPNSIGSSPHTDWGFLTLIKADEKEPALQIASEKDGKTAWHNVSAIPEGESDPSPWFIVNAGDFLAMATNGSCLSPYHRVVSTTTDRTSFVYFAYPSYECRTPSFKSNKLSFYQDQSQPSSFKGTRMTEITTQCFGDFIHDKWSQVYRY
ncbi:hypothetical protein HK103_000882 [Boothiomyces macroporosus]|uniref:Fe2OG dioxygenase domain-containing protein n=1 Tax=Boothiomyces macroporosus TaxID=261099 RepID=A0AAD5YA05_9FUNG|nr:hypothetical protein HK103_000882 [Boothiomyces macroporosus]